MSENLSRDLLLGEVRLGTPDTLQYVERVQQEVPAPTGRVDDAKLLRVLEVGRLALFFGGDEIGAEIGDVGRLIGGERPVLALVRGDPFLRFDDVLQLAGVFEVELPEGVVGEHPDDPVGRIELVRRGDVLGIEAFAIAFAAQVVEQLDVVVFVDPSEHVVGPPDLVGNLVEHSTEFLEGVVVRIDEAVCRRAIEQDLDLLGERVTCPMVRLEDSFVF
ncbi:hypothetical protein C475_22144 [Halosimplex carlsbadense 2-9-1]|uniref:Uncharacterized protein n=1 Tax=Halosimplex carlsbadense 2-9-1 TaxID=797114 RepID=M0CBG2_9EURY|nr:hypothetical protein C475_22144 [Halosimplex carlsbadense 2-9-1]